MTGPTSRTAADLEGLACVASATGDATRAARLFGAAEAIRELSHHLLFPWDCVDYAPYIAIAREVLGADGYEAAVAEGRQMTLQEAVEAAHGLRIGGDSE